MIIRAATGGDADVLTDLAHRAKAHWGYPASWMREWDPQLTIIPGYLEAHDVWVAERDGTIVGNCGLHPLTLAPQVRRRHVASIGIAVAAEAQGQGIGNALMQAMCDYADRWLGLLRLELTVYVDNARAIALYRRFGFETEGRMRGYAMRDGELVDAFSMARIHPQPPTIAPQPGVRSTP